MGLMILYRTDVPMLKVANMQRQRLAACLGVAVAVFASNIQVGLSRLFLGLYNTALFLFMLVVPTCYAIFKWLKTVEWRTCFVSFYFSQTLNEKE